MGGIAFIAASKFIHVCVCWGRGSACVGGWV